MASKHQGSFRLFRLWGIDVFMHWSWFLVAYYQISMREGSYSSVIWNVWEYLALFVIVTMHEFGHSLACRSVGGQADRIILWPLGGIAYVAPPRRAGAQLWSIAAGPLVNVVLFPVLLGLVMLCGGFTHVVTSGGLPTNDLQTLATMIFYINTGLLVFNLMPIYPLDGGQILRSLLWFGVGEARSLMAAAIIGFIGVAVLIGVAIWIHSMWFGVMCTFILVRCWGGLMYARNLAKLEEAPRREGCACPVCKAPPPRGEFWICSKCRTKFDTFDTMAACPKCGTTFATTACTACGAMQPIANWMSPPATPPALPPEAIIIP